MDAEVTYVSGMTAMVEDRFVERLLDVEGQRWRWSLDIGLELISTGFAQ